MPFGIYVPLNLFKALKRAGNDAICFGYALQPLSPEPSALSPQRAPLYCFGIYAPLNLELSIIHIIIYAINKGSHVANLRQNKPL